jgi:capsular polysaccharide biosynthesis protein
MEFLDYLRLVLRHGVVVVCAVLIGLLAGATSIAVATPTYTASAEMFVANDLRGSQDLSASQFTLARMQSYAALVNSSQVTQGVRDQLHLNLTPEQIGTKITASVISNTVLIRLEVKDTQPARTADIANAAAQDLGSAIRVLEAPAGSTPSNSPLTVTITRPAQTPLVATSPRRTVRLGLGLVLGLGVGLLGASLLEQARRSTATAAADPKPVADRPDRHGDEASLPSWYRAGGI